MKIITPIALIMLTYFLLIPPAFAKSTNHFITIVNPIRISSYNLDPKQSVISEYEEISKRRLNATWLLTYDTMTNQDIVGVIEGMDPNQELGVFFEVTPQLAKKAGVIYQKTDSWYRANSVLSTGYTQEDRKRLIDALFMQFKNIFKFYPKSVGAWWIDAYSLSYMKQKYGIEVNLDVSDQYSRDGYQVWGQYWAMPFYPSKLNPEVPANSVNNKLGIVTLQWAPRDPLNGYGDGKASLYSTQDYLTIGLSDNYFKRLLNLYALNNDNAYGQMTVGLEGDLPGESYSGQYANQLDIVKSYQSQGDVQVITMSDFGNWYSHTFNGLSPSYVIDSPDLLGTGVESFWYQSPFYRIGLSYDQLKKELKIIDLRSYQNNFEDPYDVTPNNQLTLKESNPFVIDSITSPQTALAISSQALKSRNILNTTLKLDFINGSNILLTPNAIRFENYFNDIPKILQTSPYLLINKTALTDVTLTPLLYFPVAPEGKLIKGLTPEAVNFLKQKKIIFMILSLVIIELSTYFLLVRKMHKKKLLWFSGLLFFNIVTICVFYIVNSRSYFVSQSEIAALLFLSSRPKGSVLVEDQMCLQCSWHSKIEPAVFVNDRNYVNAVSGKPIIKDQAVFNAKTRAEGKLALKSSAVKYIYLTTYENYSESLPFSPGDYNLEEIYKNANAEIWEVNTK